MDPAPAKTSKKTSRSLDTTKGQCSRKPNRKRETSIQSPPVSELCTDNRSPDTWICKNSACRAVLSVADTFCKRCSCCICHLFDDNKDPSLWLECTSDSPSEESCGSSCHIECAFQRQKVGVTAVGQLMQLDGSYCCASCGKVSGILGYWKKQLTIAEDARRVDNLCYRIHLCFRLLDGTSKFQELHKIVLDAKSTLENEVGPLNEVSASMARGIVSRLSVAAEVQALCSAAIRMADQFSAKVSDATAKDGSLSAACKFIFEEVTATSVVLVLVELSTASSDDIVGFKLWYSKASEATHTKDPAATFPRSQRKILISNLQPCTEYSFRIVSYTETGDVGHSEAKCFTESVEIIRKNPLAVILPHNEGTSGAKDVETDSGFNTRDLGKILRLVCPQERGHPDDFPSRNGLDLNVSVVPDLNEDVVPLLESDNGGSMGRTDWALQVRNEEAAAVESHDVVSRKRPLGKKDEAHDSDSAMLNGSSLGPEESFEDCVKTIRWLECQGHIKQEFRMKFLTWFGLRSGEQERRVVNTFIQTLMDDPKSLAEQLVHSFDDIVNNAAKKPRNGFCGNLWH